jgi:Ino eighty subunit 1
MSGVPGRDLDGPDPRNSLRHVLTMEPEPKVDPEPGHEFGLASTTGHYHEAELIKKELAPAAQLSNLGPVQNDHDSFMDDGASGHDSSAKSKDEYASHAANATGARRTANGSVSSVYSGNKIRHLKKEDGVPLWRKDIQYDFLRGVFDNDQKVFHKASDGTFGYNFADIYLDAMAKSSKCSKILKEKLLNDRPAAVNMAMVCLLVNVGRMNTTLNCESTLAWLVLPADCIKFSLK